jgi:hypothetical protein
MSGSNGRRPGKGLHLNNIMSSHDNRRSWSMSREIAPAAALESPIEHDLDLLAPSLPQRQILCRRTSGA